MSLETFGAYLTLPPNWEAGVSFKTKWNTSILIAITGAEQRSGLFTCPRWAIRYRMDTLSSSESNWLLRVLFNNLHKIIGVPLWPDRTVLDSQALAGQKDLVCDETDYRRFVAGHPVIIIDPSDWTSYEVGEIDSIAGGTITLVDNLVSTWDATLDVYPLMAAHLISVQDVTHVTDYVSSTIIDASSTMEAVSNPAAYSYDSATDFWPSSIQPEWSGTPQLKIKHPFSKLEFLGVATTESNYDETTLEWKARFVCSTKVEIQALLDIFNGKRGRFGSMFVPTWRSDLVITAAFDAAERDFEFEDISYYSEWWLADTAHFVSFDFPDGTVLQRRIIDVADPTHFTINESLGKAATADEVKSVRVSFMPYSRFSIDELDLNYENENTAWTALTFSSIPKETPNLLTTTSSSSSTTSSSSSTYSTTSSTASTTSTTA